jgi:Right handed beta helix region
MSDNVAPRERRYVIRWLRPWPVAWLVMICVAVVLIGSNSLSQFASGLVHGGQESHAVALPVFHVSGPPKAICGDAQTLNGPASPPAGAVVVPAGDDSHVNFGKPGTTYWFAPGVHVLGPGEYTQIVPGDGAAFTGAPGAVLDGKHQNAYAFSGYATHVTISFLTIQNFGSWGGNQNQGVVNHESSPYWTIDRTTVRDNAGAGVMIGSHDRLTNSCLADNQQYGFNAYAPNGVNSVTIQHNEITGNDTYNWEARQKGCGCTGGGKFWDVNGAIVTDNWVNANHSVGLWADTDNRGFEVADNYISGNYSNGLIYEISYNAEISGNTFVKNGIGSGPTHASFPTAAIYISESGGDNRVPGPYSGMLEITNNTFVNNWSGVILWENANRFCNSPANTSGGYCTLVNSGVVTVKSCNAANMDKQPYIQDCRWKTQNVAVDHNVFDFDAAAVSPQCNAATGCGFQGVFSEFGTYPSWSPYQRTIVEEAITYHQDNRFFDNTYNGPWQFMAYQQGKVVGWKAWISAPYSQDSESAASASTKNG